MSAEPLQALLERLCRGDEQAAGSPFPLSPAAQ
jgi:hypothetical protein